MRITNTKQYMPDALDGDQPELLWGNRAPDGDEGPWKDAPQGTRYVRRNGHQTEVYLKTSNNFRDSDWMMVEGSIAKYLTKADFTDGGGASGTYTFAEQIPLGAIAEYSTVSDVTAWGGDTTAVIVIGDGTDVDRYNTGTPSVLSTIAHLSVGAPSGTAYHAAAIAPVVTVTGGSDFTAIAATARLMVRIKYKR